MADDRTMVSYAQNCEDVMLRRCFRGRRDGFYIDVGAWDPTRDSTTRHFYERGWRGVNVEPSPHHFAAFPAARPRDVNLNVALGPAPGEVVLHEFPGTPLSTTRRAWARSFAKLGLTGGERVVPVTTLRAVCEQYADRPIDFLKIDVEGDELDVIAGGAWDAWRPRVVLVEALSPYVRVPTWQAWEGVLLSQRYEFAYFDGLNRFYVRQEDRALASHFTTPPNLFDYFTPWRLARLEERCRAWQVERPAALAGAAALEGLAAAQAGPDAAATLGRAAGLLRGFADWFEAE
ncbi:MAG: FkbM family methyltransferase [Candidatus Rokuibacteriota bacterium]